MTKTLHACWNCCRERFPGEPPSIERTQCEDACESLLPQGIDLDPDFDPIGAKANPSEAWDPATYVSANSQVYAGVVCRCAESLVEKESNEQLLSAEIFEHLPEFMDSADARCFVDVLAPCERAALMADVLRWQAQIEALSAEQFEAIKSQIEAEVVLRMELGGRQGEEAYREELNRLLGELWYEQVVQSGPSYTVTCAGETE